MLLFFKKTHNLWQSVGNLLYSKRSDLDLDVYIQIFSSQSQCLIVYEKWVRKETGLETARSLALFDQQEESITDENTLRKVGCRYTVRGRERYIWFGPHTAFTVTEHIQIQVSLWLRKTQGCLPPQETGIQELGTIKTAAEAVRMGDVKTQIRGPMTEHQGILTDKKQRNILQFVEHENNQVISRMWRANQCR